jgi:hypothetical protein
MRDIWQRMLRRENERRQVAMCASADCGAALMIARDSALASIGERRRVRGSRVPARRQLARCKSAAAVEAAQRSGSALLSVAVGTAAAAATCGANRCGVVPLHRSRACRLLVASSWRR